ncbi:Exosome complex component RRP40 [Erysiphe neolycopersici]|uniref:Ribosomal RNA-processing protein 40 n=1 Tax=Erysiphe neolycopersici TaxID=212602 RepID=A0A420HWR8_9PEZI|nr:Exosome complex component RRP40 [Erysiphe neolycopersici]
MGTEAFVLPGDTLDAGALPSHPVLPLKIGPGLRHTPPDTVRSTVAGHLCIDRRKNAIWVEYKGSRYIPTTGDLVIATIQKSATDFYYASISDYTAFASLPQLSFEGASRKTRPQLAAGALVYARISLANKHMDPELECYSPSTGKSEGLGPLIGGMLFPISLLMARRLMLPKSAEKGKIVILEEFESIGIAFEIAVGRNGKLWVDSKSVKTTLAIGKSIQEVDDKCLNPADQKKLAKKIIKDMRS